ncbi:MAG: 3-oxoadipate--succinyl-CoA transferase subunit A [Euryarchaeota archaeon RBG_19FT_COMBO_69_17]|nr:MAG: 3-oxoadipate--succinyl-CoA transferase subunit A [Euryarchaeota archaeon RBG_19FT_COMBO_69_17]
MKEAVSKFVRDGDTAYLAGFTHLIPFAAGHEIIRQKKKDLTLCRATPDIIYDQMIAAGCAKKLVFSYAGNPGVGSLRCFRRSLEKGVPQGIEIEEYTHFGLSGRLFAGATNMPFLPVRTNAGSDLPANNPRIRAVTDPYTGDEVSVVPPLRPDVAVVHVQRCDAAGNAHIWGIVGEQKDAAFASKRVIISAEEIVDEEIIRSDPNRTLIPDFIVSAVVREPWCAHPSYTQGYYDRDNAFYVSWDDITKEHESTMEWMEEWVYGVEDRAAYVRKLGPEKVKRLLPKPAHAAPVDYGSV